MSATIELPLVGGGTARISAYDLDLVAPYRWRKLCCTDGQVYVRTSIRRDGKQRTLMMHRLILGLDFGNPLEGEHRDGDGLNNTRENLRTATRFENARNRRHTKNKCGFKGVTKSSTNRYMAAIGDKSIGYLGTFSSPEEAAAAYDRAAQQKYGEFAAPNSEIRRRG